jgi:hypothetical protein
MERRRAEDGLQGQRDEQLAARETMGSCTVVHGLVRTVERGMNILPLDNLPEERCYRDSLSKMM